MPHRLSSRTAQQYRWPCAQNIKLLFDFRGVEGRRTALKSMSPHVTLCIACVTLQNMRFFAELFIGFYPSIGM